MPAGLPAEIIIKRQFAMNGYFINILLNHSILIPAIIGGIRFRSIAHAYYPFIFLMWLGLLNETLSLILIYTIRSNAVNSNIYVLIEYLVVLVQFYTWNNSFIKRYYFFAGLGLIVWIADNFLIHAINDNNSIFRIFYSFIIVFFSIDQINKLIINERKSLIKNAVFLICSTFFIYYSCKAFVEVFNAFDLGLSNGFNRHVFMVLYFANVLSNIVYAIAILCIPTKQEFTMPY